MHLLSGEGVFIGIALTANLFKDGLCLEPDIAQTKLFSFPCCSRHDWPFHIIPTFHMHNKCFNELDFCLSFLTLLPLFDKI